MVPMISHRKLENVLKSTSKPNSLPVTKGILRRNNPEEDIVIHDQKMSYRAMIIKTALFCDVKKIVHSLIK